MKIIALLALGVAVCLPIPAQAGDPPPFPEFTFKMSKPPKAGTGKRITVQIEPEPDGPRANETAIPGSPDAPDAPVSSYAWFWDSVSPAIETDGTARLREALLNLSGGPGGASVKGPRLQTIQGIARSEGEHVLRATIGTKVSPALVLAVIAVESGGRRSAESHKGAQGLMQLMPDTARRFGADDSLSPAQNIRAGVAYLDWLLAEFGGDAVLALAGYNAGENAVKAHKGVPPFAETRDYVPKVLAAFQVASGLCKTRPELISDGCALNLAMN
ncbi:lytic transglycosylase domain-containing protein [Roseovarius sp. EGI FJ00037]|uniref:lytic transglycosylase domain-containing protein n=1 Tax=Roseovarius sp. TaxID=1486281 RepID=UPI0022A8B6C7|nr:lytic transglycosylase domain-containing protein [Roseovarius sp. EGI FJ00037]MCZ0812683.1 lytic transglycosylase domain-containing protein [Roseovarius sp. EGI FJ00037]